MEKVLDPMGEFTDNLVISNKQEEVSALAYGLLGNEQYATDFVSMYTLAHTIKLFLK